LRDLKTGEKPLRMTQRESGKRVFRKNTMNLHLGGVRKGQEYKTNQGGTRTKGKEQRGLVYQKLEKKKKTREPYHTKTKKSFAKKKGSKKKKKKEEGTQVVRDRAINLCYLRRKNEKEN